MQINYTKWYWPISWMPLEYSSERSVVDEAKQIPVDFNILNNPLQGMKLKDKVKGTKQTR